MRTRSVLANPLRVVSLLVIMLAALSAAPRLTVARQPAHVPAWLRAHIGTRDGQIAKVVLRRARALYREKVKDGVVRNPCYFAMDATRPNDLGHNRLGRRFYIICEAAHSFRAISAGHGGGRHLRGIANFRNGRTCAKNFSNAMDSKLTDGGAYVTAEIKRSFKGYYRVSSRRKVPFVRPFVQFDGEGETSNARKREIGGHPAVLLRAQCRLKRPRSRYANHDGYVPFGKLVVYAGGRSNGCTSWSPTDIRRIMAIVKRGPTTLYIYPAKADIKAVARAVKAHKSLRRAGLYWNASCLGQIRVPKFWPKRTLGPIIARYKQEHPPAPYRPLPLCKGQ